MNKNILIVGAGQLGSRHLQGLLKLEGNHNIYVIDPSPDSLKTAGRRADEITNEHRICYKNDWNNMPDCFDLAIVATNANVREKIVAGLLCHYQIKYLVLEKVLFQDLESFKTIAAMIDEQKVKAWVNHPRRMFDSYKKLKQEIIPDTPKVYQVIGGNWGLACNGLHFIDIISFLSGSAPASVDAEWVDEQLMESKRLGFVEFTGTIKGRLENGSVFQIASLKGEPTPVTISIADSNARHIIQEGGTPMIYRLNKDNAFKLEESWFSMAYQSNLTFLLATRILAEGNCDLPTYAEAQKAHELFIAALLDKYASITKIKTKTLPIT